MPGTRHHSLRGRPVAVPFCDLLRQQSAGRGLWPAQLRKGSLPQSLQRSCSFARDIGQRYLFRKSTDRLRATSLITPTRGAEISPKGKGADASFCHFPTFPSFPLERKPSTGRREVRERRKEGKRTRGPKRILIAAGSLIRPASSFCVTRPAGSLHPRQGWPDK